MKSKTWTIGELLAVTTGYLEKKEIESPRLNAELLLAHQLDIDRVNIYLRFDQPLNEREIAGYRSLIRRRVNREPLQYITGSQEFWSLEFQVGPQALIPRPETELLVESVIKLFKVEPCSTPEGARILDLGTGCGALAVSLAKELETPSIYASDLSGDALDLARSNARKHGVEGRINFNQGDLFEPFKEENITFDIILSNPPYVPSGVIESLTPEVRVHEPRMALDGGPDGMVFIERIIREAADYLNPGGWVLLEMDPDQTGDALSLFKAVKHYGMIERVRDYSRKYRVVICRANS